jgi:hypothetical protein
MVTTILSTWLLNNDQETMQLSYSQLLDDNFVAACGERKGNAVDLLQGIEF